MLNHFIHRPILSIVISVILTLLGALALTRLPITQFPAVAPPEVNVTVEYPGANAETVTKAAIEPLERAINGVPGMKYMTSDAGNDGVGVIQIAFEVGTNADIAAVNVQARITDIMGELPQTVIKNGVAIGKEENDMLLYINLYSDDPSVDERFLYNYAHLNMLSELKRVKGVGFVDILGAKEYAMRIWLKPDKMLAYNISAEEVMQAIQDQNVEAAPGKIGESSDTRNVQALEYVIKYTGRFDTKEEYENIPIRADADGKILHIKDIADVELGTAFFDVDARFEGKPAAAIMIKQLPGSNAREVIAGVKEQLEAIKKASFLKGMNYEIGYDASRFLDASIYEVLRTLMEAFLLVSLVVFLFLQDIRSTLIPAVAVPVSLIGTLFFMQFFGFSLNLITLFALVLAIGIVVDNAIVVVEAVHTKMHEQHLAPLPATELAMKEISGAIVAITLVMAAVFVPVAFLSGPSGIFYRQFSVTMAIAIVLSGVVALTLSPALCAITLKNPAADTGRVKRTWAFLAAFNRWYDSLSERYQRLLGRVLGRRALTFGMLLLFCAGTGVLGKVLHTGFIPDEDKGTFYVSVTTPPGSTLERTKAMVDEVRKSCDGIDAIQSVSTMAGTNILSDGTGATYGTCLINLKPWDERRQSVEEVIKLLEEKTRYIKDATLDFFPPPPVPGYGNASGFVLLLLDKTGNDDLKQMESVVNQFVKDLRARPEIGSAFTIYDASYPQYLLHMDVDKAAQKGVTVNNAMSALQTLLGSDYATNFIKFGKTFKVMVQALPQYRAQPEDILKLTVKNDAGEMVSLSAFITLEKVFGVEQVTRYNTYNSAELNGEPAAGYSSGSAIAAIQEVARTKLPKGYDIDWAGITRDEVSAGNEAIYVFLISLVFVYLLLSAQYESFSLPLPVILSLPTGVFGAFFLLWALGLENNLYAQIALIMLIGLLGKNAILIVEFAAMKHRDGLTPLQAAIEGAKIRLRPILMTSFAFIAGMVPLVFASGAGAVGNRTIGTASAGGMLFGTVFGILVVPGLYLVFARVSERHPLVKDEEETPLTEL